MLHSVFERAQRDRVVTFNPCVHIGLRWGELIALEPRHLDLIKRTLSVEETAVEVSIKNSPPAPMAQITTTQTYLHALPDADQENLYARNRIRAGRPIPTTAHRARSKRTSGEPQLRQVRTKGSPPPPGIGPAARPATPSGRASVHQQ